MSGTTDAATGPLLLTGIECAVRASWDAETCTPDSGLRRLREEYELLRERVLDRLGVAGAPQRP
ncbi:hypothetical protein ACN2WE_22340 [Streptomyces sp. cg28]|uniref:hypothetical protein n=1 Tax=Streptomyces sp. cg28 TaxID=3403457 RepID=UPI003B21B49B